MLFGKPRCLAEIIRARGDRGADRFERLEDLRDALRRHAEPPVQERVADLER